MLAALLVAAAILPFDGAITRFVLASNGAEGAARALVPRIGGDVKRELEFVQQFGAITSLVIVGLLILMLDRARFRRVADMALAAAATAGACWGLKLAIGRPRPRFDDPGVFLSPWRTYELTIDGQRVARHAWEIGSGIKADLWSMPSSHTAAGVALAIFLCSAYPKIRPLAIGLACLVGVARVLLGAHYVSDVLVGAAVGYAISMPIVSRRLGQRLLAGRPAGANALPPASTR